MLVERLLLCLCAFLHPIRNMLDTVKQYLKNKQQHSVQKFS